MAYFDVNQPVEGGAATILKMLNQYATPEAAQMDFDKAPRGRDYLTSQYQSITGDAFADPFRDMASDRTNAVMQAAVHGAGIASGSNLGSRLISPIPAPITVSGGEGKDVTAPAPLGLQRVAALQSALTPRSENILQSDRYVNSSFADRATTIDHPAVKQILAEVGTKPRTNAEVNPIFQMDPKTGKPVAAAQFDTDLLQSPTFMNLINRDRATAARIYEAKTGRKMDMDIASQVAQTQAQKANRQQVIEDLKKTGTVDRVTGKLMVTHMRKDPTSGNVVPVREEASDIEKAAWHAEGGTKGTYGFDVGGALPPPPNLTPAELKDFQGRMQSHIEAGRSPEEAHDLAWREGHAEQKAKLATGGKATSSDGPDLLHQLMQFAPSEYGDLLLNNQATVLNAVKSQYNVPLRLLNAGLGAVGETRRVPLIPDIPKRRPARFSRGDVNERESAADLISRLFARGSAAYNQ